MEGEPVVLDTDTLSKLSRGNPFVKERALAYLADFGRLTITAVTVFERLRGYRIAIRDGLLGMQHGSALRKLAGGGIAACCPAAGASGGQRDLLRSVNPLVDATPPQSRIVWP